jgi:uncharacterized protein (DUF488 family)
VPPEKIWTVGHSNRTLDDLINILSEHGIDLLVDIRTVPRSRHNPQFNREALPDPLARAGIGYVHMPGLGGLRHPRRDSINTAWRNLSFRGYADYMQTPEFDSHLENLIAQAALRRVAVMCAESVPWRCHRSLLADALTARHIPVDHLMSTGKADAHRLTSFAVVDRDRVSYPGETGTLFS